MVVNFTSTIARRAISHVGLLLCLSALASRGYCQTSANQQVCKDAQVIAVHGAWIATPGDRRLVNWSCVNDGEFVKFVANDKGGQITVIYHRGKKLVHTVECKPRKPRCRNSYQIELPAAKPNQMSTYDKVRDFFRSLFDDEESQPVPGILQGSLPPRPALTCSVGQKVNVEDIFRPGAYRVYIKALNAEAEVASLNQPNTVENSHETWDVSDTATGSQAGWFGSTKRGGSHISLLVSEDLERPAFYEVAAEPAETGAPIEAIWLLIAPEARCKPMLEAYEEAVGFTQTWPKHTPKDAVQNFRLRFLQGLASRPY